MVPIVGVDAQADGQIPLLLADQRMPEMTGVEFLSRLRDNPESRRARNRSSLSPASSTPTIWS